jgi:hypothetical protein
MSYDNYEPFYLKTSSTTKMYDYYKKPTRSNTFSNFDKNNNHYNSIRDNLRKTVNRQYKQQNCDENPMYSSEAASSTDSDYDEAISDNINKKIKENEIIYKQSKLIRKKFDHLISKHQYESSIHSTASVKRSSSLQSNFYCELQLECV